MSEPGPTLLLIEMLDSHGRVQWRERVALDSGHARATIGRALDADVVLDDPYVAPLHAALEIAADGRLLVSDLDSNNGIMAGGKRLHRVSGIDFPDGLLQLGRTRLRIRTSRETLAAEKPDQLRPASMLHDPAWIAGIGAIAGAAQLIYSNWLNAPRDLTSMVVTTLLSAVAGAGIWVAFWALLSRVILGEWRWLRHAAIFLGVAVVFYAISGLLDLGWFAFSLPYWANRATWAGAIALACALFLHLTNASNISAKRAALIACIVPAISGGAGQWVQNRAQMRDVNHIDAGLRIYPPAMRLTRAGSVEDYFGNAAQLREAAIQKRKASQIDDDDADASDEEQ